MPQNPLRPQDERDVAKEREVKPLQSPNGVGQPQSVPTIGEPGMMSQPTTQGVEAGGQQTQQPMAQQDITQPMPVADPVMDMITAPPRLPNTKGIAQLSGDSVANTYDPFEEIDNRIKKNTMSLDTASMVQSLNRSVSPPQYQTNWDDDWEDAYDSVERAVGDIRVKNMNLAQSNGFGLNPRNIGQGGRSNAPALDTDIQARGLSSELAKSIEDNLLTGSNIPVVGTIGDMWRDVSKTVVGLGVLGVNWLAEVSPGRKIYKDKQAWDEKVQWASGQVNTALSPTKFDPTKLKFGDYGTGGTGALLYGLSTIPSVLAGGVYDIADYTKWAFTGKMPYKDSRVFDAVLKGRDWAFSNRWSEEKYLGLQEPENLKIGQVTGNWYWDLPENIHKVTGGRVGLRAAHWLTQATPAVLAELFMDVPSDFLLANYARGTKNVLTGASMPKLKSAPPIRGLDAASIENADITRNLDLGGDLTPHRQVSNVPVQKGLDQTTPPDVQAPKVNPATGDPVPNYQVGTTEFEWRQPSPKGEKPTTYANWWTPVSLSSNPSDTIRKITAATENKGRVQGLSLPKKYDPIERELFSVQYGNPLDVFSTRVIRRDNQELTYVAQNLPDPWLSGGISRPLTDNELKALEFAEPLAMSRYGTPILPPAKDRTPLALPEVSSAPRIAGVTSPKKLEDLINVRARNIYDLKKALPGSDLTELTNRIRQNDIEIQVTKAKLLDDNSLYAATKHELPEALRTDIPEDMVDGEVMLQSQFNLDALAVTKSTIEAQVDEINLKIEEIDQQLNVLGDIGRRDIDLSLRTQEWSGADVPELDSSNPTPTLDTPNDYEVIDITSYPDVEGFRVEGNEAPSDWGSQTYGLEDETPYHVDSDLDNDMLELGDDIPTAPPDEVEVPEPMEGIAEPEQVPETTEYTGQYFNPLPPEAEAMLKRVNPELYEQYQSWKAAGAPEKPKEEYVPHTYETKVDTPETIGKELFPDGNFRLLTRGEFKRLNEVYVSATESGIDFDLFHNYQAWKDKKGLKGFADSADLQKEIEESERQLASGGKPKGRKPMSYEEEQEIKRVVDELREEMFGKKKEVRVPTAYEHLGIDSNMRFLTKAEEAYLFEIEGSNTKKYWDWKESKGYGDEDYAPSKPTDEEWIAKTKEHKAKNEVVLFTDEEMEAIRAREEAERAAKGNWWERDYDDEGNLVDADGNIIEETTTESIEPKGDSLEPDKVVKLNKLGIEDVSNRPDFVKKGISQYFDMRTPEEQIRDKKWIKELINSATSEDDVEWFIQGASIPVPDKVKAGDLDATLEYFNEGGDLDDWYQKTGQLADVGNADNDGLSSRLNIVLQAVKRGDKKTIEEVGWLQGWTAGKNLSGGGQVVTDWLIGDIQQFGRNWQDLSGDLTLVSYVNLFHVKKLLGEDRFFELFHDFIFNSPRYNGISGLSSEVNPPEEIYKIITEIFKGDAPPRAKFSGVGEVTPEQVKAYTGKSEPAKVEVQQARVVEPEVVDNRTATELVDTLNTTKLIAAYKQVLDKLPNPPSRTIHKGNVREFLKGALLEGGDKFNKTLLKALVDSDAPGLGTASMSGKYGSIAFDLFDDDYRAWDMGRREFLENNTLPDGVPIEHINQMTDAIRLYIGGSSSINAAVGQGHKALLKENFDHIRGIDAFIEYKGKWTGSDKLYRGLPDEVSIPVEKVGDTFDSPAYLSTSFNKDTEFWEVARNRLVIDNDGKYGVSVGNMDEREVLLPRNLKFKVNKIETRGAGTTYHVSIIGKVKDPYDIPPLVPPKVVEFEPEIKKPPEFESFNEVGYNKAMSFGDKYLKKLTTTEFLHGTRLHESMQLRKIDPIVGGSTGEFGIGIYLTDDQDVARSAATKFDSINKPPVLDVTKGVPQVRAVNTRHLFNVLDLSKPIPKGNIRKLFTEAAYYATNNSEFSESLLDNVNRLGDVWNSFRVKYRDAYGEPPTEGVVRKFQQYVTKSFRNIGVHAGYFENNGIKTLVVYDNSKLGMEGVVKLDGVPEDMGLALKAQEYLDAQTMAQLGDDVSKANWLTSQRELAEWNLHNHTRNLYEVQAEMMDNIEMGMDAEVALSKKVESKKLKAFDDVEQNLEKRTVDDYEIKSVDSSPCPPMTKKFTKRGKR